MRFRLVVDGESHEVDVERSSKGLRVGIDGVEYRPRMQKDRDVVIVRIGPRHHRIRFHGRAVLVDEGCHVISVTDIQGGPVTRSLGEGLRAIQLLEIRSPMPGRVIRILAPTGTRVRRGEVLLVFEAMKMQNEIPAPRDGIVRDVRVAEGESITADRVVAVLEGS